ncbi:MFS transporter [Acinetobacter larvae]|uniref:Alpha-ketoglutarate permease n=1 Tax=Acinetobacter larvae TaxID=1789224 RepID=A0A1B2M0L5_9GAMM|nr:MFS transporter [Acinetobacter larvae]AOA58744.1 alpha-ketoglutarate permease [Acinetobacter larvae]
MTTPHDANTNQIANANLTFGQRIKSIVGGSAGNLVEYYDWYVYSAFTLYFAPVFFPQSSGTIQLLQAAVIFALGFFMRPLGAWMMGIYSDRKGRKAGLTLSVALMSIGSLVIAFLPTYNSIGLIAPIILLIARLLQGLSLGGEYGASATYLSELATPKNRGFYASFQYITLISGQLIALAVLLILQATLSKEDLQAWGWRIPFFIGAVLAITVLWIRRNMIETEQSVAAQKRGESKKSSAFALFKQYPKEALKVFFLTAGGTLSFYAYTTYTQKFLVNTSGFSKETATEINACAVLFFMILQPIAGHLSDRFGKKVMITFFGIGGVLFTYPLFTMLSGTNNPYTAFFLIAAGLLITTGYTSINVIAKSELFPAHIRSLGVALPYALATSIFGGTTEAVGLLFKNFNFESGFYIYISAMIAISAGTYIFTKNPEQLDKDKI